MSPHQRSTLFAIAQFVLIAIFGLVFFLEPGPAVFVSMIIVGTVIAIAGLVLMAAAFVSLREVIQVAPEPKAGGHLVTSGLYRYLRHPIYTGIVLLVVGLFLREPALYVAVAGVVLIGFLVVKSKFEEQLLRERYPEYAEYMRRSWGVISK